MASTRSGKRKAKTKPLAKAKPKAKSKAKNKAKVKPAPKANAKAKPKLKRATSAHDEQALVSAAYAPQLSISFFLAVFVLSSMTIVLALHTILAEE